MTAAALVTEAKLQGRESYKQAKPLPAAVSQQSICRIISARLRGQIVQAEVLCSAGLTSLTQPC